MTVRILLLRLSERLQEKLLRTFFYACSGYKVIVEIVVCLFSFGIVAQVSISIAKIMGQAALVCDVLAVTTREKPHYFVRQA